MEDYLIKDELRQKVTTFILIIALILDLVILYFSHYLNVSSYVSNFLEIIGLPQWISPIVPTISYGVIYKILYLIFKKYLWKNKIFYKWHKIPNLNGQWKGKLTAISYDNKEIDMTLTIKQNWDQICLECTFEESRSHGYCCAIIYDNGHLYPTLNFKFINKNHENPGRNSYFGYNQIEIISEDEMSGEYCNSRDNGNNYGNKGTFTLKKK